MKIYRCITFCLLMFIVCFIVTSFSWAEANATPEDNDLIISMDIREKPLRTVLEDISERTGYRVKVSDDLLDIHISGNFKDMTLTALLGRMLKGRNVFILEDDQAKLITVLTSLSKNDTVTTVYVENMPSASAENYSLSDLQQVRLSLDKAFNDKEVEIESSPGILYQDMVATQRQLDQKLNTANGKSEIEASPEIAYQKLVDTQEKLNYTINKKNSGVQVPSGVLYNKVNRVQGELDTSIISDESTVEASPGVSYKELLANRLELDKQLAVRN